MKKGLKIFLGISIPLVLATGGFLVYRNYRRKKEDDLAIEIGAVDWTKRQVPYTFYANGKKVSSGISFWRADLVGKPTMGSSNKNGLVENFLTNGTILTGTSLGETKTGKIIDFTSKTIRDYAGSDVDSDIKKTKQTLTNLFI